MKLFYSRIDLNECVCSIRSFFWCCGKVYFCSSEVIELNNRTAHNYECDLKAFDLFLFEKYNIVYRLPSTPIIYIYVNYIVDLMHGAWVSKLMIWTDEINCFRFLSIFHFYIQLKKSWMVVRSYFIFYLLIDHAQNQLRHKMGAKGNKKIKSKMYFLLFF